jgi:hypothetical protein
VTGGCREAMPCPSLPLVGPDVRISRIRLSGKHFVIGDRVRNETSVLSMLSDLASILPKAVCWAANPSEPHCGPGGCCPLVRGGPCGQAAAGRFDRRTFTVGPLRSRPVKPFLTPTRPSDSRWGAIAHAGSLRFLNLSFPARCLQPPRRARRLHTGVASSTVADFTISGRMVTPILRNEAESSSLALRLAGSPPRSSAWGLLLSPPGRLHDGHLVFMMISFHFIREVRLGLTHPRRGDAAI